MDLSSSKAVIEALEHVQLFQYMNVAGVTLAVTDYFLTIDLEVALIWNSRWSLSKVLFLITRYLPFFESALLLYRTFGHNIPLSFCNTGYKISAGLIIAGVVVAEIILSMRTWAIWGKDRRVAVGLVTFVIAGATTSIPIIIKFSGTAQFVDPPVSNFLGCFLLGGSHILSIEWILLMAYDFCLLLLLAIKAYQTSGLPQSSQLLSITLHDGILYYFYLSMLSMMNVIIIWKFPPDFINLLTMLERVMHAVLTCRVVLYMREQTVSASSAEYSVTATMPQFIGQQA
ncbi:hypothetical protein BDQ17DRAFT_1409375 [Cyathus striatus]|nr:hypothetical protein BDQ17DRAFT_1409375 [Cyathus striatus]